MLSRSVHAAAEAKQSARAALLMHKISPAFVAASGLPESFSASATSALWIWMAQIDALLGVAVPAFRRSSLVTEAEGASFLSLPALSDGEIAAVFADAKTQVMPNLAEGAALLLQSWNRAIPAGSILHAADPGYATLYLARFLIDAVGNRPKRYSFGSIFADKRGRVNSDAKILANAGKWDAVAYMYGVQPGRSGAKIPEAVLETLLSNSYWPNTRENASSLLKAMARAGYLRAAILALPRVRADAGGNLPRNFIFWHLRYAKLKEAKLLLDGPWRNAFFSTWIYDNSAFLLYAGRARLLCNAGAP